jgi:hypothetical protein
MGKEERRKERTLPSDSGIPTTDLVSELTLLFSCHPLEHLGERSRFPGQVVIVVIVVIVSVPAACFRANSGTFRKPRTSILAVFLTTSPPFSASFYTLPRPPNLTGGIVSVSSVSLLDEDVFLPLLNILVMNTTHGLRGAGDAAGSMTMINCDDDEHDSA